MTSRAGARSVERDASSRAHAPRARNHRKRSPRAVRGSQFAHSRTPAHSRTMPQTRPLGTTGFSIAPLVLGTNVFGWTVDQPTAFSILDAFVDHGFDAIDTADSYSNWAPGNSGGVPETIIGNWPPSSAPRRDRGHVTPQRSSGMRGRAGTMTP